MPEPTYTGEQSPLIDSTRSTVPDCMNGGCKRSVGGGSSRNQTVLTEAFKPEIPTVCDVVIDPKTSVPGSHLLDREQKFIP